MEWWEPVRCIPQHEVHELQPLAAQEAVAVGGLHERAAQRVEHVLHRLLLLRAARVVPFVELHRNDTFHWLYVPEE